MEYSKKLLELVQKIVIGNIKYLHISLCYE